MFGGSQLALVSPALVTDCLMVTPLDVHRCEAFGAISC